MLHNVWKKTSKDIYVKLKNNNNNSEIIIYSSCQFYRNFVLTHVYLVVNILIGFYILHLLPKYIIFTKNQRNLLHNNPFYF